jgi:XTP/dITP diphosphohydrolase
MKTIVFATKNQGKVKEIKEILKGLSVEVLTMEEAGISIEIEEHGTSFEENAILKAEALTKYTDAIVLADDSGLEIDALNGEPGIYSARYLGEDTSYSFKNQKILERLKGLSKGERSARFVCAIAAASSQIETMTTIGFMEGYIGEEAKGDNGFGYDPIFFIEPGISTAQMSKEAKNEISHRGQALRFMAEKLKPLLEDE